MNVATLLCFQEETKLLICEACEYAINPGASIRRHLDDKHPDIPHGTRSVLAAQFESVGNLACEDPRVKEMEEEGKMNAKLPLSRGGFACGEPGCRYAGSSSKSMENHFRAQHGQDGDAKPRWRSNVLYQRMFGKGALFEVRCDGPLPEARRRSDDELKTSYDDLLLERGRQFAIPPTAPNSQELTLWDKKTRWYENFAGKDMCKLHARAAREERQGAMGLRRLWSASDAVLRDLHHSCQNELEHVLRLVRTNDKGADKPYPKPFRFVHENTLPRYIHVWASFLTYVLRSYEESDAEWLKVSADGEKLVERIRDELLSEAADEQGLRESVFDFSLWCLQSSPQSDFHHPLLNWMGVMGFDVERQTWQMPWEYNPFLSHLIYNIRLLLLGSFRRTCPPESEQRVEKAEEFTKRWLRDGSFTAYTSICSKRAYCKAASQNYWGSARVMLNGSKTVLHFKSDDFEICRLKSMVRGWQEECLGLLDGLLFRTQRPKNREVDRLRDNIFWAKNGATMVDTNGQVLKTNPLDVLERARANGAGEGRALHDFIRGISHESAPKRHYLAKVAAFLDLLFLLVHFEGGMPPRGTEQAVFKFANSWSSLRNVLIMEGMVATVSWYNKTDGTKEEPTIIARFLPLCVGELVVDYIAEVRPFLDLMTAVSAVEVGGPFCPLLWQKDGKPWTTEHISGLMGRKTEESFGTRITLNTWRQLSVALRREFIHKEPQGVVDGTTAHTLQAGHGGEMEEHHYALRADQIGSLSPEAITAFSKVSMAWHAFWEVPTVTQVSRRQPTRPQTSAARQQRSSDFPPSEVALAASDGEREGATWHEGFPPEIDSWAGGSRLGGPGRGAERLYGRADVLDKLKRLYRYDGFLSPEQENAVNLVINTTDDLVIRLPTAAGKSMAITLPAAIETGKTTLVLVPYNTLRHDLIDKCQQIGIQAAYWDAHVKEDYPVVLVVPENITCDSFQLYLRKLLDRDMLRRIVFDECHHIIQDKSWRESWKSVSQTFAGAAIQKVFMSGSLPDLFLDELRQVMKISPACNQIRLPITRTNIQHRVTKTEDERQARQKIKAQCDLYRKTPNPRTLIFAKTKREVMDLADALGCSFVHAEQHADVRKSTLDDFCSSEPRSTKRILVATTILSEGVTLGVGHVIQYGAPYDIVSYTQQAGRAGRGGEPCTSSIVLWNDELRCVKARDKQDHGVLFRFLTTNECRQTILGAYLDGSFKARCDGTPCDNCWGASAPDEKSHHEMLQSISQEKSHLQDLFSYTIGSDMGSSSPAANSELLPHLGPDFQEKQRYYQSLYATPSANSELFAHLRPDFQEKQRYYQSLYATPSPPIPYGTSSLCPPSATSSFQPASVSSPFQIPQTPLRQGSQLMLPPDGSYSSRELSSPRIPETPIFGGVRNTFLNSSDMTTLSSMLPVSNKRSSGDDTFDSLNPKRQRIQTTDHTSNGFISALQIPDLLSINLGEVVGITKFEDIIVRVAQIIKSLLFSDFTTLLFTIAEMTLDLKSQQYCFNCWLRGHGMKGTNHSRDQHFDLNTIKENWQPIKKTLRFPRGYFHIHYHCCLPLQAPFHSASFPMQAQCQWSQADLVRDTIVFGYQDLEANTAFTNWSIATNLTSAELGKKLISLYPLRDNTDIPLIILIFLTITLSRYYYYKNNS